ncbi:hypothetical protein P3L10_034473 [Capsicum annuum]
MYKIYKSIHYIKKLVGCMTFRLILRSFVGKGALGSNLIESALSSLPKYPELISALTILGRRQRHLYIGLRRNPVSIPTFDSLGDALISSQTVNTVDDIFAHH